MQIWSLSFQHFYWLLILVSTCPAGSVPCESICVWVGLLSGWLLAGEVAGCRIYTSYTQQIGLTCLAFSYNGTALSMPPCSFTPSVLRSSFQSCTD